MILERDSLYCLYRLISIAIEKKLPEIEYSFEITQKKNRKEKTKRYKLSFNSKPSQKKKFRISKQKIFKLRNRELFMESIYTYIISNSFVNL